MTGNRVNNFNYNEENNGFVIRTFKEKWETEPEFLDLKMKGYHLVIWRHEGLGQLNGYVGVKRTHPYFGKGMYERQICNLNVHGGITFAGKNINRGFKKGFWYFGFDTAHVFDYAPFADLALGHVSASDDPLVQQISRILEKIETLPTTKTKEMYKDIEFVTKETSSLYAQLEEAAQRQPNYKHNFAKEYRLLARAKRRAAYL
ncbi:hypothetical protein NDS46_31620 (plasmid) [Paenibacillus thiaminolyticus]|uniref:hypothetical protein n=1 Tax=Paenibacillus thiaminolyticus TaxID=49283 RepID=UPI002330E97A|nr:hypothetical protein [Paenibacillus thiaminolyticus]WCF11508.1 hypothetical protein NDS46_31620 [Paenibacillus thiaminolyticus]